MSLDFGLLLSIIPFLGNIIKKYKLKQDLIRELEIPLDTLGMSYRRFMNCVYIIFGATGFALFLQPQFEPKEHAKEIAQELDESYEQMLLDVRKLLRIIRIHIESFRKVLTDKEMRTLEVLMEGIQDGGVDYSFITENRLVVDTLVEQMRGKNIFLDTLNQEVNIFKRKIGLDGLKISDKQLSHDVVKLMQKILTNPKNIPQIMKKLAKEYK